MARLPRRAKLAIASVILGATLALLINGSSASRTIVQTEPLSQSEFIRLYYDESSPYALPDPTSAIYEPAFSTTPAPSPSPTSSPVKTKTKTVVKSSVKVSTSYRPNRRFNAATTAARAYAKDRIGAKQFSCLDVLWDHESGWRTFAHNGSGAYGIPQALPGSKMASAGADWRTNPTTQVRWGLRYISGRYGSACSALNHYYRYHWY